MESHRLSLVPQHSPRSVHDSLFGVRVQVQGFKGQPYVVLNGPGPESHRDVSVITHQAGGNPGTARMSADERRCPPESQPSPASSMLHCQKHPEILRPYDPQCNNLSFLPLEASVDGPDQQTTGQAAHRSRPRIPLPAQGPEDLKNEESEAKAAFLGRQLPARSPNAVETESILSVGQLINQFNSSQRRGRGGPRNRLDPEQCHRSRSLDSSRTSDSSSSSSSSSRASSLRGTRADTASEIYPPGSARARLLGGQTSPTKKKEEKSASPLLKGHSRLLNSHLRQADDSDQRDTQVTLSTLTGRSWFNRACSFAGCSLTR